jgi:hypothetical protein
MPFVFTGSRRRGSTHRRIAYLLCLGLTVLFGAAAYAGGPIGLYPSAPDLVWRGDFEGSSGSLRGNCVLGADGYCISETIRPEQIQIVENPVAQGRFAARFEVKYGDVFTNPYNGVTYSDSRSLLDPSPSGYFGEGEDLWYRWQVLLPSDFRLDYPKWDELRSSDATTTARHGSGLNISTHHPGGGSAPLYIGTNRDGFYACTVNFDTRACDTSNLGPAIRGRWVDFLMHAHWSPNADGRLEIWMDGQQKLSKAGANMYPNYPGKSHWLVVGLYRNGRVGDPSLRYTDGSRVYGDDGTPTVVYLDGFAIGKSRDAVMSAGSLTSPPGPGTSPQVSSSTNGGPPNLGSGPTVMEAATGCSSTSGTSLGVLALAAILVCSWASRSRSRRLAAIAKPASNLQLVRSR